VLILGESGTGKELVARALYNHSRRQDKPFLAINCGAIAEGLLESELFGHERGAFTGAERRRIGKFEQCHGGTIFLDEAGDMPLATQVKLLRLLQEGTFERVGGNETQTVDVRVIAATNQNLDQLIEQGRFRRDLYYRLKGVTIHLPPLRERREDIAELAHYFLFRFNRQLGTAVQTISPEALTLLQNYAWPGNVRELQSVIREALIVSAGSVLLADFLPPELHSVTDGETSASATPVERAGLDNTVTDLPLAVAPISTTDWNGLAQFLETALSNGESDVYRRALELFDRNVLLRALAQVGGQQFKAAALLGLSRPTLRSKLRSLGLTVEKVVASRSESRPG
jgi:two-component system nitrogen regulation response regulator GlnG